MHPNRDKMTAIVERAEAEVRLYKMMASIHAEEHDARDRLIEDIK